jgi:glycosyltransferase involved in cell wall biosynthesis
MKILLIIDSLGSGGAQRQIALLAKELRQKGNEVDLFHYYPQDFFLNEIKEYGVSVYFVQKRNKFGIDVIKGLIRVLRKHKYDIVLSYLDNPNFYSIVSKKLSGTNALHLTSERSRTDFKVKNLRSFLLRWTHKQSDWVVFNSFHEKQNWIDNFPIIKNKSCTIYNATDLKEFYPRDEEFNRKGKILCIGSVGRDKNGLCLIEALHILRGTLEISCTWMGNIVLGIPARREYHKQMMDKIHLLKLGKIWNWKEPQKNVRQVLHEHDVLILPSIVEGVPNVVCEALASGVPVIASDLFDHPFLVKNGDRGFLFNPFSPNSLANAIIRFYDSCDEDYKQMCKRARSFAEKELSIEKMANAYEQLFKNLLSR